MEGPLENDFCSICLEKFNVPCQANCSHWFCGGCIMSVWEHASTSRPCICPLCRRQITLLIPTEANGKPNVAQILLYNRRFGQQGNGLRERIQDLPFLLRRLYPELVDPLGSLPSVIRVRIYMAMINLVIYILIPIDIIPEGILGMVGYLDDLVAALFFILSIAALYRSVLYRRHGGA